MEFLSLSRRRSSSRNVPGGEERGETDVFAGYTETCEQRPETTRRRLCCEKLSTSHDVKGFAIGLFLERIVVERANDDLC